VSFVSYKSSVSEIYADILDQKYGASSARTSGPSGQSTILFSSDFKEAGQFDNMRSYM
jgi:hypothetical protein